MGHIYRLPTAKAVRAPVDQTVIRNLRDTVGVTRYNQIAEDATFALADRLGQLERAYRDGDMTMCYRHAVNICGISSQIGLVGVTNVAADVMACVRDKNPSLPAVMERLNLLAEASLFSVLDVS